MYPVSPNTVLANALSHAEDVLTPRVLTDAPEAHQFKHAGLRQAADDGGYKYDPEAADAVRDAVIRSNPTNHLSQMNAIAKSLGGGLFASYIGKPSSRTSPSRRPGAGSPWTKQPQGHR